jgi:hypothetical protein
LSDRPETRADDPFSDRHPTSHERLTGLPWDASYHDGPAPWVEFAAADAFHLERLGRMFVTVLDCGLLHTFDGDERPEYVASLASVTEYDRTLYVLCFSDDGPDTGPHTISQRELRAAFNPGSGWNVAAIEPDRVETRYDDDGAPAWFATIKRI